MAYGIGQQLGNYRLIRYLGHGAFADVYLGEHRYLNSYAALKVLRVPLGDQDVPRFLSEARTLVRLRHPNIVRVLDYAVDRGTPVLVMEHASGGSMRQRYPEGSYLSLAAVVSYVKQVAAALQYAHNRYLIHRDVKPENILLGSDQVPLLSDFGLALFTPSPELLSTQEAAGTPSYIAPEQLRGHPSFAGDQYALGIVAYEWLCGMRPFKGNRWEVAHQHLTAAPPPLRQLCPELPVGVEQVVLRALAKDPQERFVSVQAFALALERASLENGSAREHDSEVTAPLKPIAGPSSVISTASTLPNSQAMRQVFLSASPADNAFAARLKVDLRPHSVLFLNEQADSTPDALDQESMVRQAIRAAHLILVVLSPHTQTSRAVKEHMHVANIYGRRIVFVWIAGSEVATLLPVPDAWEKTAVIDVFDARGPSYESALQQVIACLEQDAEVSTFAAPDRAEPQREPRNPYKGLRAFTEAEAPDFFGRDAPVEKLIDTLNGILSVESLRMPNTRLLAVIGPSGSGKSSMVMAGLLPRLRGGAIAGSKQWVYLDPIVPGRRPFEALARVLEPYLPEKSLRSIREDLEDDSARGLHLLATRPVKRSAAKVFLVIDQFEELFAPHLPEQERQRFIDVLLTAVTEPDGPVVVVLTLRADFYDRPMRYPQLSRVIEAHRTAVLPMEVEDLRAVIEEPAMQPDVQVTFERNLVGDLVFETQGQAGALPLLEFTLDQLFQRREGHWLTQYAYQEIGGVKGAVAKHAESTYSSLPSEEYRALARALFLRLIDPGTTEQDTTRRRAALAELSLLDPRQTALIREVAAAFIAARLLTTNEVAGTTTIEVSHEALIREWTRLADWLHEAREDIVLQQAISADTAEWVQRSRPQDRLYRGSQLAEAQAWAARNLPSVEEMSFIEASRQHEEREETEKHAQQARELALQRQSTRRQRYVIGLMGVTSIVLIVALAFTLFQQVQLQNTNQQLRASLPASVTNNHDSGPGSLREAIAHARPNSTITFEKDLQGPILLTNEIDITQSLIISGPGAKLLSISGQGKHRVFRVHKGAVVTILNLTIRDGFAANCPGGCDTRGINSNLIISDNDEHGGGAILNEANATLTLINVTVSTSTAGYGAIFNNGTLTLLGSHISANKTSGLFNSNQGTVTLEGSIVSGNSGATYGGGMNLWGGSALILASTIFDNTAIYGGGLYIYTASNSIVATLVNSTISNNTAITSGGGICSPQNGPNLVYTTVYENRAGAVGGGIAENAGEGCGNYASDPNKNNYVDLKGSIIAGDSAPKDADIAGNVSLDYPNLIQHLSSGTYVISCDQNTSRGCALGKKSLFNLSPRLGPLQDNGGPTPTHALLVGSPALDQIAVDPSDPYGICANPFSPVYPVLSDQRGESRPQGKGCDLGAYEAQR